MPSGVYIRTKKHRQIISKAQMGNKRALGHTHKYIPTKEMCRKKSIEMIGNQYALGYEHTQETRKKMSKLLRGRIFTKKHRRNISKGRIGLKRKPFFQKRLVRICL